MKIIENSHPPLVAMTCNVLLIAIVRGSSECRYIRWFCESWEVKCDQERVLVCAR